MTLRVFLAGRVAVEADGRVVDEGSLPGLQGRVVLAILAAERERALSREELAEEVWAGSLPSAWEPALRAVISKVRGALAGVGLDRDSLTGTCGTYQMHLPATTWVDLEAAAGALHQAETLVRAGQLDQACGWALAARAIAARPLLPGAEGPWVTRRRARLREIHLRSLEVLAQVWVGRGELGLAVADAEEALRLAPFRESTYRTLMLAHCAAGNRAEALRVYQRCRDLLTEELGVDPAQETEAMYLGMLRSGG